MAIVVDEYGQTEGLVALEDIIEVIVGDILDEHDEEEVDIMRLATGNGYIVNGTTNLEELEDLFHIEFPKEDIDTVNGFGSKNYVCANLNLSRNYYNRIVCCGFFIA